MGSLLKTGISKVSGAMYQSQKGVTASFCCVLFCLGKFSVVRKIIFSDLKQNCLMKRRLAFVSGQVSLFPAPQGKARCDQPGFGNLLFDFLLEIIPCGCSCHLKLHTEGPSDLIKLIILIFSISVPFHFYCS